MAELLDKEFDLEKIWSTCISPDLPNEVNVRRETLESQLANLKVQKKLDAIVSDEAGLGICLRARIVFADSKMTKGEFRNAVARGSNEHNSFDIEPEEIAKPLQDLIQLSNNRPAPGQLVLLVFQFVNRRRRAKGLPALTHADFTGKKFAGPHAIKQFRSWIRGVPLVDHFQDIEEKGRLKFYLSHNRSAAISEIINILSDPDRAHVCVAHQAGMTFGLSALAHLLCKEAFYRDQLPPFPICYLPLTRGIGPVTLPVLVGKLRAFFAGENPGEAKPPYSNKELEEAIYDIKRGLWQSPSILILDGHRGSSDWYSTLTAIIQDDPLVGLLPRLIFPPYEGVHVEEATHWPGKSKILVLSESNLKHLRPFGVESVEVDYPRPADIRTLIADQANAVAIQRFRNISTLTQVVARNEWLKSDGSLQLMDLSLGLGFKYDGKPLRVEQSTAGLCHLYIDELKKNKSLTGMLCFLRMVALSDTGLRISTAIDLLQHWRTVAAAPENAFLKDDRLPANITPSKIREWIDKLGGILSEGPDEALPELDELPHPLEFPYMSEKVALPPSPEAKPRVINVTLNEVKEAIVQQLMSSEPDVGRAMHRALTEVCIRQQTVLFRNQLDDSLTSIRFFRRVIQGLYHGFLSLPDRPEAPFAHLPYARVIPNHAGRAFLRLYVILYRAMLENPPGWHLSRFHAANMLKVDLLLLAANPGVLNRSRQPKLQVIEVAPEHGPLGFDHLLGVATAAYRSNSRLHLRQAIRLGAALATTSNQKTQFSRLAIDRRMLSFKKAGFEKLRKACLESLQAVDFQPRNWQQLESLNDKIGKCAPGETDYAIERGVRAWVARMTPSRSVSELDNWAALLDRLAEAYAHEADATDDPTLAFTSFRLAFIAYLCVERLRAHILSIDPLSRVYALDGHATRVFTRVALKMNILIGKNAILLGAPSQEFLLNRARRLADIHTRQSFRHPTEHASGLILESYFARLIGSNLHLASTFLMRAERYVGKAGDASRVHLRFLLERAKVLRLLGRNEHEQSDKRAILLAAAKRDAELIKDVAKHYRFRFWSRLADRQLELIAALRTIREEA